MFSCYIGLAGKLFPLTFEEDFLVVPLDITNFASHEGCINKALQQFGKVMISALMCSAVDFNDIQPKAFMYYIFLIAD